jgi:hypothetical protein
VNLTPQQRTRLITYWTYHRRPPTGRGQLMRIAPQLAMFAVLGAIPAAGAFLDDPFISRLSLVMLGVTVGMAVSAITVVRFTRRQWPLMEHIIDWDRVEALKREHTPDVQ